MGKADIHGWVTVVNGLTMDMRNQDLGMDLGGAYTGRFWCVILCVSSSLATGLISSGSGAWRGSSQSQ